MEDLSVNVKILFAIVVAVVVAVLIGVVGLLRLRDASDAAQRISVSNVASIKAVRQVQAAYLQARLTLLNQAVSQSKTDVAGYTAEFDTRVQEFDAALTAYRDGHPAGNRDTIDRLGEQWQVFVGIGRDELLPAGARNDFVDWSQIRDTKVKPITSEIQKEVAELDQAETGDATRSAATALDGYHSGRRAIIIIMVVGALLALALGTLTARRIVASLIRVREVCETLAAGDLTRTSGVTSRDEPGQMAQALDTAIGNLRDTVHTIDASAASLAGAAEQMSNTTAQIAGSAQDSSTQAQAVSAAAEQISRSVETVSAGSEQMGASIREISQNASEAAQVAAQAVTITGSTSETMNKLGESSAEIGSVIKVITAIAEQTNLLALNATIEAARAGDAGKGFAVVASEVKDLAQETSRATDDIARRVETIQADAGGAVAAINEISQVIARISDFQTTIASAVEEQTATTAEMNRSVAEAATGTTDIAHKITLVAQAAADTSTGIAETQQATGALARMSSDLTSVVARFRL